MKHLYVLMSWPEDMDMLWIKFLTFVSVFCSSNLSCSMIVHIDKKWRGHKFSEFACFILIYDILKNNISTCYCLASVYNGLL